MISLNLAVTRCWPHKSFRESAISSECKCRCSFFSRTRLSPPWPASSPTILPLRANRRRWPACFESWTVFPRKRQKDCWPPNSRKTRPDVVADRCRERRRLAAKKGSSTPGSCLPTYAGDLDKREDLCNPQRKLRKCHPRTLISVDRLPAGYCVELRGDPLRIRSQVSRVFFLRGHNVHHI